MFKLIFMIILSGHVIGAIAAALHFIVDSAKFFYLNVYFCITSELYGDRTCVNS